MLPWHSWCYLTLMTSNMLSYSVDGTIYEHIIANSRLYLGVPVTNYVSLPYTYEVTVSGATCTVTPSQDYATVFMLSPTATNLTSF